MQLNFFTLDECQPSLGSAASLCVQITWCNHKLHDSVELHSATTNYMILWDFVVQVQSTWFSTCCKCKLHATDTNYTMRYILLVLCYSEQNDVTCARKFTIPPHWCVLRWNECQLAEGSAASLQVQIPWNRRKLHDVHNTSEQNNVTCARKFTVLPHWCLSPSNECQPAEGSAALLQVQITWSSKYPLGDNLSLESHHVQQHNILSYLQNWPPP